MAAEESASNTIQEAVQASSSGRRELTISGVYLKIIGEDLSVSKEFKQELRITFTCQGPACKMCFHDGAEQVFEVIVRGVANIYQAGATRMLLRVSQGSVVVTTSSQNDTTQLLNHLHSHVTGGEKRLAKQSVFTLRTEESSSKQYFQFYGYLSQQQNMMQDYVRTSTYQSAMLQNVADFKDKVVLDVGAGTGILSFFAVQAGARKVYAVEASSMAVHCAKLVAANGLSDKIIVLAGKVEEVDIPERVDMIISEPMGYMLYNERMIESYLHAKKWLKPTGNMFPSKGLLYIAPFSDEGLYIEQYNKSTFWTQTYFHGVNLSALSAVAQQECFRQPVLDTYDVRIVMAKPITHTTDFLTTNETDLHKISVPLRYTLWSTGVMHGLAFWFDVAFCGSQATVWLSTAPTQTPTHWYQIRCLLPRPILVHTGQVVSGNITLTANQNQSYDILIGLGIEGTDIQVSGTYDLKNPCFRYMGAPSVVPGTHHTNPTESYFENITPSPSNTATLIPLASGVTVGGTKVSTQPPNVVNSETLLQTSLENMEPGGYQPSPQTLTTSISPANQIMYSVNSGVGGGYPVSSGVGGGYKYQPYQTVASGATSFRPPYTVANGY